MKANIQAQKGFTLIELMIVIAIVGILAAIALPAYQDYTVRAKISEPTAKLAEAKTTISEFYAANGSLPATLAAAGVEGRQAQIQTLVIDSLTYSLNSGSPFVRVVVKGSTFPGGTTGSTDRTFELLATSVPTARTLQWTCRPGTVATAMETKYLPANCRSN